MRSTGPASATESSHAGALVLGPFDDRLVAERAARAQRVRRVGQEASVDPEQVLHAVDVGRARSELPRAVPPIERRPDPRPRDFLREHDLAIAAVGVGHGELDRVLTDAGRAQRWLLGSVLPCADLVLPQALLSQ